MSRGIAHLNNAGASIPPAPVLDAVIEHLRLEAEIGGYEAADDRADRVEHTYDALARLINCAPDEIAVVENATRAWDMAFYSLKLQAGDRILTTTAEYASNYIPMRQVADRTGAAVVVVPDDEHGQVDVDRLTAMLDERVKLVSLVHVPSQSGLVQPAAAVGAACRAAGVPLLLDACQSIGQMPVDVDEIGCDMLSATGRKFLRGPRGTGFLYVRRGLIESLEPPLLDLRAAEWQPDGSYVIRPDARRFENWETNVATKIGLGVAADYALEVGLEAIRDRVRALAGELRARLAERPDVTVHDRGQVLGATVTFTVDGRQPAEVVATLRAAGVNTSTSPATTAQLDFGPRGLTEVVRASPHYPNDIDDLDRLLDALAFNV